MTELQTRAMADPERPVDTTPQLLSSSGAPMEAAPVDANAPAPVIVDASGAEIKKELPPEKDWSKHKFPIEMFENRVVLNRDDREEQSEGGIQIPVDARERTMTGTVVAVGPGMKKADGTYVPMMGQPEPLKVNDRVLFEQFRQMIIIKIEGRVYHITRDTDLIGRVTGHVKVKAGERGKSVD